ncbi:cilia- and flagella-associated protein 58 [Fasciola hepatica]|uniref:Cilia- and flagella-associated protein 58 n=1 Tax=Fasciola hepatica TaxID=6192 RepID=A0A4E0RKB9_FASHE|nr:cilia- and flagella-associated protein 58 [Fasciola hepatica]
MASQQKIAEADQKKTVIKPAVDDNAYEALEKEFDEVLNELEGNKGLEKFKEEYEKLMRAFNKSHENEKRLMKKCRELKAEIVSNSAKVAQAVKLSSDDQGNMTALKKEIEKAWKMVDDAAEKETKARETIDRLKGEIAHLSKLVEQGGTAASGVDNLAEMTKMKEKLIRERDEHQDENRKLRQQIEETRTRTVNYQNELLESQNKITELTQEIQAKNTEAQRELRKKERMERELKQVRAEVEAKMEEMRLTSTAVEKLKQELKQKEEENRGTKVSLEQASRQLQVTETKLRECQSKLETQMQVTDSVMVENQTRLAEVKHREEEVASMKAECQKLLKQKEASQRKLRQTDEEKAQLEATRDRLRSEIQAYENEMEMMRKSLDSDRRACDELSKEREQLNKSLTKAIAQTNKQSNLLKMHEMSKQNLEQEIINYRDEAQKQRKIIYRLERERDRYITEASELTQKVLQHMDELKYREMQIFENKKRIAEAETKLKQQQNLYEAVRSDRNLYSKNLIEAQDEIIEMKRKLKVLSHQIDQLKDDIATKEAILVKENLERQKVDKEKEQLARDLQRMKVQAAENRAYIEAQEAEEGKLLKIVAEAEQERLRERKEHEQVITERDVLGSQLVRRNDELALLYEKIRIQQSVISKGEKQYNEKLRDLNLLKQEVRKLRREKAMLQSTTCKINDLKSEVHRVQRDLIRERTRARALEEELQNPVNVHRWRKLEIYYFDGWRDFNFLPEGSDPSTYEMILKIQVLQKRLISKTEEVVEKELLIQEKEKLYVELKHILARQPGPEVAEQLNIYQNMIRDKTKQMKAMAAEMNLYENQIVQYKGELDILNKEMRELKKRYFAQKKNKRLAPEAEIETANNMNQNNSIKPQNTKDERGKFTGGGFRLTQPLS